MTNASSDIDASVTKLSSNDEDIKVSNDDDIELAKKDEDVVSFVPRTKPFIVLVATCAALGGLIFGKFASSNVSKSHFSFHSCCLSLLSTYANTGYDIAGAGATFVMDGFKEHFGWECAIDDIGCTPASEGEMDRDKGLINGLFGIGATIGAISNSYIAETYGRRPCLAVSNCVFILGASIQTYSPVMWVMWLGRIFSGMGVGMLSMCVPVYIAECSPEHVRGQLSTLWQVAVTSGILIASAANLGLKNWSDGWRLSYGGNILFALLLLVCLTFMPESPRYLAAHGTEEQLIEALNKLRFEDEVTAETKKLQKEVEEDKLIGDAAWPEVVSDDNNMKRRLLLGVSFQGFQQLCGINAIMFYAPDILNTFFTEDQAIYGTFYLNGINFLSTFITVYAVEKVGRVKLLVYGGCVVSF